MDHGIVRGPAGDISLCSPYKSFREPGNYDLIPDIVDTSLPSEQLTIAERIRDDLIRTLPSIFEENPEKISHLEQIIQETAQALYDRSFESIGFARYEVAELNSEISKKGYREEINNCSTLSIEQITAIIRDAIDKMAVMLLEGLSLSETEKEKLEAIKKRIACHQRAAITIGIFYNETEKAFGEDQFFNEEIKFFLQKYGDLKNALLEKINYLIAGLTGMANVPFYSFLDAVGRPWVLDDYAYIPEEDTTKDTVVGLHILSKMKGVAKVDWRRDNPSLLNVTMETGDVCVYRQIPITHAPWPFFIHDYRSQGKTLQGVRNGEILERWPNTIYYSTLHSRGRFIEIVQNAIIWPYW